MKTTTENFVSLLLIALDFGASESTVYSWHIAGFNFATFLEQTPWNASLNALICSSLVTRFCCSEVCGKRGKLIIVRTRASCAWFPYRTAGH